MAAPLRVEASGPEFPWRPPFTVDLLYELPDNGLRYEVLGGSLVVSPQSAPGHNLAHDRLRALLIARLPVFGGRQLDQLAGPADLVGQTDLAALKNRHSIR